MEEKKYAIFDFDGVLADTERYYDVFWDEMGERYKTGIPHFAGVIKGTTLPHILAKYFADRTEETRQRIAQESNKFDHEDIPFPPIPGSLEFVRELKANGIPVALATSSDNIKMERAFREMGIVGLFDAIVTADMIEHGKPAPDCYLLAAKKLGAEPSACLVFEDSFAGIEAAKAAGMRVVALATTNEAGKLKEKTEQVIPNLEGRTVRDFQAWCE